MKKEDKRRCSVCDIPHFERNNYFYGKLMTERDFTAEQCYFNEKRRLINRTILGWGVVCGLDVVAVEGDPTKVLVKPGLAIDSCGREILVCEEQEVLLAPQESACDKEQTGKSEGGQEVVICLQYHECLTEPVPMPPVACDLKDRCQFNRVRDSYRISVIPLHGHACHHQPLCPRSAEDRDKTLHHYLCDRLREDCPEFHESHCVILATIKLNQDNNLVGQIDSCSQRKLVYSNQLLYDLIHCNHGDLPHITQISWHHKEHYTWHALVLLLNAGLEVTFNKPMQSDTISAHTFLLAVIKEDEATGYRIVKYIPAGKIEKHGEKEIDGKTCTRKATFFVEEGWKGDELVGAHSELRYGAQFEVILRGSSIMSCDGKALDGDFVGGRLPSGNGTQGGDFVSWFSVGAKQKRETAAKKKGAQEKE